MNWKPCGSLPLRSIGRSPGWHASAATIKSFSIITSVQTYVPNKKTARRRSLCDSDRNGDQATRSAGPFCLRRYAMKPIPAKPRTIIALVKERPQRGGNRGDKFMPVLIGIIHDVGLYPADAIKFCFRKPIATGPD